MLEHIKTIFVDIDNTLTHGDILEQGSDELLWNNLVLQLIARHHSQKYQCEFVQSRHAIRQDALDRVFWDYPDFIDAFELDQQKVVDDIVQLHRNRIAIHDHVVEVITQLSKAGKKLCIMSNNPVQGSLWKLQAIGLSDGHSSPYFDAIYGSNNARGQKSVHQMWQRAIDASQQSLHEIATVGDNLNEDGLVPHCLGIAHHYILTHGQTNHSQHPGITFINHWQALLAC
jgi:FMN phosphatase YigB (HAD superfamily)